MPDAVSRTILIAPMKNVFFQIAALILLLTAGAKIYSSTGSMPILSRLDPILPLTVKQVLLSVASVEIIVAACLLASQNNRLRSASLLWLSGNYMAYRTALHFSNIKKPCHCLGNITDALHVAPDVANTAEWLIMGYFICGSLPYLLIAMEQSSVVPKQT